MSAMADTQIDTSTTQAAESNVIQWLEPVVTQDIKSVDGGGYEFDAILASENINFPDMSKMDVSRFRQNAPLLINHDHNKVVGQWKNVRYDAPNWWGTMQFTPEDALADEWRNKVKHRTVRAVSIGALPARDREGNSYPRLVEASLVAVGLDKTALLQAQLQTKGNNSEETAMTTDTQQETEAQAQAQVAETQSTHVMITQAQLDELVAKASNSTADQVEQRIKTAQAESLTVQSIVQSAKSLLPNGFDATGKTVRDVLVQAVHKSVDDVEKKSDDYLQGAVDILVKHRAVPTEQSSAKNEFTPASLNQLLTHKRK